MTAAVVGWKLKMKMDFETPPNQEREPPNWWVLIVVLGIGAVAMAFYAMRLFSGK